jgi:integrase
VINLAAEVQEKEVPRGSEAEIKGKMVEYAFWMQKQGFRPTTIIGRTKLLKVLLKRGANLYDPESFKDVIARQKWCDGRKGNAVDAYSTFLKMTGGTWETPKYQAIQKIPLIPTETEVDQLIASCSNRMATFLQLLKETAIRPGEAWVLTWIDVDLVTKTVRITPEKNSNPRICHISSTLASMLESLPKTFGNRVFSLPDKRLDNFGNNFRKQRLRIADKLKNPRIAQITFKTLRHFKATLEYHRTKDILHVMQKLGHKSIKNTLIYVHLAEELFKDQQEYISKVAKNTLDACALVDAGFEYVCDFEGAKIFRRKKY